MLKKLEHTADRPVSVRAGEAAYPSLFPRGLEYNPPVHGTWNIVHIGMQVPQAHQIYVCSDNCMRGVVMTADEMGFGGRFSCVTLSERDLLLDSLDTVTIEGTADVIEKLGYHPPMVMLFLVCVHIFLGSDLDYIYRTLQERYPDIYFARCFMDPIRQKTGPTPEQELRGAMFDPIQKLPADPRAVNLLGCDVPLEPGSDLCRVLRENGFQLRQLSDCETFSDFLALGDAAFSLCNYTTGVSGVQRLAERLGTPFLYLSPSFSYDEIAQDLDRLKSALGIPTTGGYEQEIDACEKRLAALQASLAGAPVSIDYTAVPRPLSLARLLLTHGFRVPSVYLEAVNPDEEGDLNFLRENFPDLVFRSTIRPELRTAERPASRTLAVGQKAAFFENTPHFVNMIEGGGLWGFSGILGLCERMEKALAEEKDTRDIVMRKGLGCSSECATPDWRESQ